MAVGDGDESKSILETGKLVFVEMYEIWRYDCLHTARFS